MAALVVPFLAGSGAAMEANSEKGCNLMEYLVHFNFKAPLATNDPQYMLATDVALATMHIVSIDRWSTTLEDYVEIRRVPCW